MKSPERPGASAESLENERNAADVIRELRSNSEDAAIEYVGSATSGFQADPIFRGANGEMLPVSDWEFELKKNLEGKKSKIRTPQSEEELPNFLGKKEQYIGRSKELGENMFRFSLEFGRLCPKEGEFNQDLMDEYVRALALIRARGQEPLLTINHFTMPQFLVDVDAKGNMLSGAWDNPEVVKHFRFYIEHVAKYLADQDRMRNVLSADHFDKKSQDKFLDEGIVKYFMSINEPITVVENGYIFGGFPPFKKLRFDRVGEVLGRMVEAHDITRNELKEMGRTMNLPSDREPQVGVGHNWNDFADELNFIHEKHKNMTDRFERDQTETDFLGMQYYFHMTPSPLGKKDRDYGDHPDFGDINPASMGKMLKQMNERYPNKDIIITEMGFSDAADERRPYWILQTMRYVLEAKRAGVPVKGVLLWSLVNNFEWDRGMQQKFGIFDEKELSEPLVPGERGPNGIRSWEAWSSMIDAIRNPSDESLARLEASYQKATKQYLAAKKA